MEKINENEFYDAIRLDEFLPPNKVHRFTFIKKVKEYGVGCKLHGTMDDRIKLLLKTADESIIRDCRVNKSRKSNFDEFWSVTEKKVAADIQKMLRVTWSLI